MEEQKQCVICNNIKPLTDFQENGNWSYCRECNKDRSLRYYHANKQQLNRKVLCEICNKEMDRPNYYKHIKTNIHLRKLSQFHF